MALTQLHAGGSLSLDKMQHTGLIYFEVIKDQSLKENQMLGIKPNVLVNL